ncbi:Trk K+ transport system, NAD-binding component [Marinobacter segnicrescens]|uniref:Trk K+ transport system, NAD-binding component n=1 Tax=Marinobacter segnicrescens TaxID=430453 RepID=A0A1I0FF44_9GAMM|nr:MULTISPECIES: ion channel DMI1 [Marinobacter]UZD65234.1 ion channel DMI1 [Marinobacter sp. AN1]SET56790.1 Trk K+ transport system, NAD-binding component [Marinobacter segnicrescens]
MLPFRIVDRVKFLVERQLVKGAGFQLLVVAAFIAIISFIGGILVVPLDGDFDHIGNAIWWAFLRLTDPGYLGDDVGAWQRIVSTLLTISGYVVFMGTLVAILTRWLIARMDELERGLTPVTLKNHIVVLGWSSQTLPLLSELLGSTGRMRRFLEKHEASRLNLVVLAEEASAEQVHELRMEPGIGSRARQVILRSGLAIQPDALHRVACLDAAAVIVPSSVHEAGSLVTSDVETVKALLSIAAQARHFQSPLPFVVAELQDVRKLPVIERAYPGAVEVVAGDVTISRLMVQNILHPGLSEVYNELLAGEGGNELYVRSGEPVAGMTLGELSAQRPEAIVLGLLQPAGQGWQVRLVAPSDTRIEAVDRVVLMARSYDATEADSHKAALPEIRRNPARMPPVPAKSRHRVLVLGWNRRVPSLVAEMASYGHSDFEVDVVSVVPASERERAISRYPGVNGGVGCRHLEADYMVEEELRQVAPADYDAILLVSSDRLASGEEADARAMVGYLQLEDLLSEGSRRPQLIMELSDPDNRQLLYGHQSEMMISSMILSHVLAQVALRRELRVVLDELFTVGGPEIQFRDPSDYPLPASADFLLLEKTLAAEGEVALGIYRKQADERGHRLQLNPPRRDYLELTPGDRLVVLAVSVDTPDPGIL